MEAADKCSFSNKSGNMPELKEIVPKISSKVTGVIAYQQQVEATVSWQKEGPSEDTD